MFDEHFQLNEQTMPVVEELGRHMPGGFFIYKAEAPEELIDEADLVTDMQEIKHYFSLKNITIRDGIDH